MIKDIIRTTHFLKVHRFLPMCLGLETGFYLSYLADKEEYFENQDGYDGWFFQRQEDIGNAICLSEYQLRKCKQKCKKMGLLDTKIKGVPPKEWYRINWEVLAVLYEKYKENQGDFQTLKNLRINPKETKGLTLKKLEDLPSRNFRINPKETLGISKETKNKETRDKETKEKIYIKKKNSDNLGVVPKTRKHNLPKHLAIEQLPKIYQESKPFHKIWLTWIGYRKSEKRKPIGPSTAKQHINKIIAANDVNCIIAAIEKAIDNGWGSFFPEQQKEHYAKQGTLRNAFHGDDADEIDYDEGTVEVNVDTGVVTRH